MCFAFVLILFLVLLFLFSVKYALFSKVAARSRYRWQGFRSKVNISIVLRVLDMLNNTRNEHLFVSIRPGLCSSISMSTR